MTYFLTRAKLDRNAPDHALRELLDPPDPNAALNAHHKLMWTLFPGRDAKRDFLWRNDQGGKFLILSAREPKSSGLFRLETKPYAPDLAEGDRLGFLLRVNATRDLSPQTTKDKAGGSKEKRSSSRRVDVVIHAMHQQGINAQSVDDNKRANRRMEFAEKMAAEWLAAQGVRRGFEIEGKIMLDDYSVRQLKRARNKTATFGVLDVRGILRVSEPAQLLETLYTGIGRARAFGCGLMLVRRA